MEQTIADLMLMEKADRDKLMADLCSWAPKLSNYSSDYKYLEAYGIWTNAYDKLSVELEECERLETELNSIGSL